jgi:hypothetical protein
MSTRFLVVGTFVGAIVLFAWQTVSNAALPWHTATMTQFANDSATARTIRSAAPQNGVYFSNYGILAAVRITPTFSDLTASTAMGPMLAKQFGLDLVATVVLLLFLGRTPSEGAVRTGVTAALAALAVSAIIELSNAIWYGFTASYSLVNVVDQTIAFFLVGATLAALRVRMERVAPTEERPAVKAKGGLPTSGSGARV